jgi:excisionase family DNA binding protein
LQGSFLIRTAQSCRSKIVALIGTSEAARRLDLSARRVAAMIEQGILKASKVGNSWVIDEAEVARVAKLKRPPGRPRRKN